MAGTLNDFLKECDMFPYSKENFELVKEASELNIASMYLENQRFMVENPSLIAESSEYMMEAVDAESVKSLEGNVSAKKGKFRARAKKIWESIVKAFKTFWNAVVARWDKFTAKAADVKKNLALVKLTPEQITEITSLVEGAVKTSGIPISDKQKSGSRGLPKNILVISEDSVKNKLAAVLCNSTIELVPSKEQYSMAMSEKQLKNFFNTLSNKLFLAAHKDALASAVKQMNDYHKDNLSKGISISKNNDEVKELIKFIEDAEKKIVEEILQDEDNGFTHGVGEINTLFADAQKVTGDSIRLYTTVVKYQEIVLNGLDKIVKKAAAAPAGSAPAKSVKAEVVED